MHEPTFGSIADLLLIEFSKDCHYAGLAAMLRGSSFWGHHKLRQLYDLKGDQSVSNAHAAESLITAAHR